MIVLGLALESFHEIQELVQGEQIVVFLDYDGTLSPIVNDPEKAFMTDEMRDVVREVANKFPTSIISGWAREKVFDFSASTSEITGHTPFQPASEFRPVSLDMSFDHLKVAISGIEGADYWKLFENLVIDIAKEHELKLTTEKMMHLRERRNGLGIQVSKERRESYAYYSLKDSPEKWKVLLRSHEQEMLERKMEVIRTWVTGHIAQQEVSMDDWAYSS
ncbi:hypothetical protein ACP4OV_025488 [Aristida adscensionis]